MLLGDLREELFGLKKEASKKKKVKVPKPPNILPNILKARKP